ncbi:hypothetical protein ACNF5F_26300, partial [Escherichia coli]|uniref:hypothetical protein n=1 Tax=Escherichia coli TaxID=562 RepID=UPI003B9F681C
SNNGSPADRILTLQSTDGNAQFSLSLETLGRLSLRYSTSGTIFAQTSLTEIQDNVWYYLEIECVLDDVNGVLRVYKDGVLLPELEFE